MKLSYTKQMFLFILILSSSIFSQKVQHPSWSKNSVIYEMNIRQYTPEGTLKAAESHLDRLKEMGVGILWLMPINPIGEKNRKGTLGSYYAVKDYRAVNKEFGSFQDLDNFVKKAHSLGIKVILDWVANHTAWDNILTTSNPEFYTKNDKGEFVKPAHDWNDVIDLNYDNKGLRKYMIESMLFWVKEHDIDGFRCDVAGMVPTDFWVEARNEISKVKDIFMLAEWDNPETVKAFDMDYAGGFHHLMNKIAKGEKKGVDVFEYFKTDTLKYPRSFFRMQFTSNHDENTYAGSEFERLGNGASAFAALSFVVPGMPLIYSGQEAGMNKRLKFFEKDTIAWDENKFGTLYTDLCELKRNFECLNNGGNSEFISIPTNDDDVIIVLRKGVKDKVLGIFNLSNKPKNLTVEQNLVEEEFSDQLTAACKFVGKKIKLVMEPWDFRVYGSK